MTSEHLNEQLESTISAGISLREVVSALRACRVLGVTRGEVQAALQAMRDQARDEASEDRILEVMDLVNGFCSREMTIWED